MKLISFLLLVYLTIFIEESAQAAYPVRCNSQQTVCEVRTKRLVVGDYVGIFDSEGYLVAFGRVKKLKGKAREIKIFKIFERIKRSHRLKRIEDEEAKKPRKFFNIRKGSSDTAYYLGLGLNSIGVGETFSAFDVSGFMQWRWKQNLYLVGRGFFLRGSGKATINKAYLEENDITLQAIGALGGVGYNFLQHDLFTLRGEGSLGVASVNLSSDGEDSPKDLVDGRVSQGVGFVMRAEAGIIIHYGSYSPMISASFLRLQNSNNYAFSAGFFAKI